MYISSTKLIINLNLHIMNKITYLCFVFLFCISFKGSSQSSGIQRVRVDFEGPMGYTRHLLLAFTSNDAASDNVDYGYDALVFDNFPDDLNWMIENDRYVIQGVGKFNNQKYYPFGMFLQNSGNIKIRLTALENFDTSINVFIYDSELGSFTSINNSDYAKSISKGNYLDRFYITFTNNPDQLNIPSSINNALSIAENDLNKTSFNYINSTKELMIKTNTSLNLNEISLYDILGKKLMSINNINSNQIKIPLANLNTSSSLIVSLMTEDGKQTNKHIIAGN